MCNMDKLMTIKEAAFDYQSKQVFHDINFELHAGEIFCLFGPNGCGKSTLLECILGLLKLKNGNIYIKDTDINLLKPKEIAQQIAYVPQVHKKTFPYKVIDIVLMGRAANTGFFGTPDPADLEIAEQSLSVVGMDKYRDTPYTMLSGGETQLIMLARALAQQTPIIVMDEPTAHLDFKHELVILENVVKLVKEQGVALIMATHFPNHAFYFENKGIRTLVALMNNKSFADFGAPSSIISEINMRKTFNIDSKLIDFPLAVGERIRQIIPVNTVSPEY